MNTLKTVALMRFMLVPLSFMGSLTKAFSAHPPTSERISRLQGPATRGA